MAFLPVRAGLRLQAKSSSFLHRGLKTLAPLDGIEPTNSSFALPKLDEMATDHLLGMLDCRAIIRAMEAARRSLESSVGVQNIKPILTHRTSRKLRKPLGAFANSKPVSC